MFARIQLGPRRLIRLVPAASVLLAALASPAAAASTPLQLIEGPPGTLEGRAGTGDGSGADNGGWFPSTPRELQLLGQYGDHHVGVVGEEIITRVDVLIWMNQPRFEDPTVGRTDLAPEEIQQERFLGALTQLMEQRLKIQGGRSQGYEQELVEQFRDREFDRLVEAYGGPQGATNRFKTWGFTPESFRQFLEERMVSGFWEDSITGKAPGPTGRAFVDRYVRPGQLYARYREYAGSRDPKLQEIVGKTEGRVSLRFLLLPIDPLAGASSARRLADTARENVANGVVTLESLASEYAPPNFRGDQSLIQDALTKALGPRLANEFPDDAEAIQKLVAEGAVGDLSPVLTYSQGGVPAAFAIYQVTARSAATEATPFADLELQKRLRKEIEDEAHEVRVSRGLAELVRSSHVAPGELRQLFLVSGQQRLRR